MSRRLPFLLRCALFCGAGLLAATAQARMESLDDDQLSDVVGQAFINLTTDAANGLNFTRINFGADIETQLNMKKLQLGQYNRSGELAGSADIAIDNFALGTVNDTTGAINPFLISNPYIEFAYDGSKMVGIRIGFGEAKGYLSGDIKTLTGNVPVDLYGTGSQLGGSISCGLLALDCPGGEDRHHSHRQLSVHRPGRAGEQLRQPRPDPRCHDRPEERHGPGHARQHHHRQPGERPAALPDLQRLQADGRPDMLQPGPVPVVPDRHRGSEQRAELHRLVERLLHLDAEPERPVARPAGSLKLVAALAGAFLNMSRNADGTAPIKVDFGQAFNGIPRQDTCLGGLNKGC